MTTSASSPRGRAESVKTACSPVPSGCTSMIGLAGFVQYAVANTISVPSGDQRAE